MAQAAHAFRGFVGAGFHASSQTDLRQALVARTLFNRFHSWETTHSQGEEIDPTSGRSDAESTSWGNYDVKFKGVLEGTTEGAIPALLRSLMGGAYSDSTVGTTGKQHLLQISDTVPSNARLSLEDRFGTDAEAETYNGLVTKVGFSLDQAGYARWNVEGLGSSPAITGSPTTPTLPDPITLMAQRKTTFTLDSDTTHVVRKLNWSLERKVDDKDYDVTSRQRRDASYDEFMAMFDAELTFQTAVELKRFFGGASVTAPQDTEAYYAANISTARSDVIAGGTAKHTVEVDLPQCLVRAVGTPMTGRDVIRQKVRGQAIYKAASGYSAQVKLINTVASY